MFYTYVLKSLVLRKYYTGHCEDAIKREKYFKSAAGRKWLKKYINK
jgi:predicted GIY-YIG superfamily endonuclease